MPDNVGWVMRPMVAGFCSYAELVNGSLSLYDVALMNDVLDVREENDRRLEQAAITKARGN